ncbi:type VII secretion protein EccE [Mycolicibacterium goodii]|uniref:type VII secretion protein EccE n=1 Tax=Mycolicibacterium goodii TaxID=134601 RepID=UPI0027E1E7DC|nr:type VII secretion protein EccE [Mycolicibacterium goodii]
MTAVATLNRPRAVNGDTRFAITMIALHGREFSPTVLVPEGADSRDTVPLGPVCALMRQFGGLELHSIDVVSIGCRTPLNGRFTARYDEIIGDRPAVGDRRTWLVLRLNPRACMQALTYRGNIAEATAAATERIRQAAVRAGCRATTCSPNEMETATNILLGGHELSDYEDHWSYLRARDEYVTPYRVAGRDLTTRLLNDVWSLRTTRTVTVIRLTRNDDGSVSAAALVRLHTTKPVPHPPMHTLHPVVGQARSALLASLPLGKRSVDLPLSYRRISFSSSRGQRLGDKSTLLLPVGPSGFIIGMSDLGHPWLYPITDPLKFTRVAINASVEVVQRLILRAVAAGATGVVHTDRPEAWQPVTDERLALIDRLDRRGRATVMISDLRSPQDAINGERGHALVIVNSTKPSEADMMITQVSQTHLVLRLPATGREVELTIMRPRNETQVLSHLLNPGRNRR